MVWEPGKGMDNFLKFLSFAFALSILASCNGDSENNIKNAKQESIFNKCESNISEYDLKVVNGDKFTGGCSCLIGETVENLSNNEAEFLDKTLVLFFKANELSRVLRGVEILNYDKQKKQLEELRQEIIQVEKSIPINEDQSDKVARNLGRALIHCNKKTET